MRDGGDRSTSGKCLPKLLFTEAMKFLAFRLQQFIIWLMESLLFPGNSESSRVSFIRSFLTLQMCWQSFRLENLTITVSVVLPTRWQASIWSEEISHPSFLRFLTRSPPEFLQTLHKEWRRYQDIFILNIGHLPITVSPK